MNWLIPQNCFISGQLKTEIGTEFELKAEVQHVEGNAGSSMEVTFSEKGLKPNITGTWKGQDKTKLQTQLKDELVFVTTGRGNLIYLFLPSISSINEISG